MLHSQDNWVIGADHVAVVYMILHQLRDSSAFLAYMLLESAACCSTMLCLPANPCAGKHNMGWQPAALSGNM